MKRDMDGMDLRNAFAQEPESCHQALMNAACSVKEEEPVKKYTFRTALIAAVIITAMMAVAIAATNGGLADWFRAHYNAVLPRTAQDILSATEKSTLEAGPVGFTINELLYDGKIAYLTVEAQLKEEGNAIILYPDSGDMHDRIGEVLAQKLNHPAVDAQTSYLEAAQLTGLPLYNVAAWLEIENYNLVAFEMMDSAVLENGNLLLVHMLYFNELYAGETLPVEVQVCAQELDMHTLEYKDEQKWRVAEKRSIPVHGVTAEKHYEPQDSAALSDHFTLTGVTAKQTSAGVYVFLHVQSDLPMTLEELFEINFEWNVLDMQGNRYPTGASLSAEFLDGKGNQLPTEVLPSEIVLENFQYMMMISADELPEYFTITDGTARIVVR